MTYEGKPLLEPMTQQEMELADAIEEAVERLYDRFTVQDIIMALTAKVISLQTELEIDDIINGVTTNEQSRTVN